MRTVLTGGRVFDVRSGSFDVVDIAIEGDRIAGIGKDLRGDDVVDVSGKALLPGLIDCHVHVLFSGIDPLTILQTPFSYRFYEAARNLEATLRCGVTTIRDAEGADLGIKKAVEDGLINGPRMQISIRLISQTGGCDDQWMPVGERVRSLYPPPYPGSPEAIVDGPAEVRKKVRELIRNGADVIKIATTGAVVSGGGGPNSTNFQLDEIEEIVAEAAAANRFVMAHAIGVEGIKNAIRGGVRSIEHGSFLDDEGIQLMIEHGTYWVPTLGADLGVIESHEAGQVVLESDLEAAHSTIAASKAAFAKGVKAGLKIAMGSDACVIPHGDNLRELALMSEWGMSPAQALIAATATSAELLGMEADLGALEMGKLADVIAVEGDPLDLQTLGARVVKVWKDGRLAVQR
jgi:imidazolonepropionase-like amidohydrolase